MTELVRGSSRDYPAATRENEERSSIARWRRPGQFRRLVTYLVLTVVCLIWIYPLLWMISASFKTEAEIFSGLSLIPDSLQWENFRRA